MSLRDDLSDNARVILEGLYECGGEANMTEMKQFTGIEENKTLLYHTEEYLEPSDFVESEVVDDGSATGITEFRLTDRGQDAVRSLVESTDDPNLVEQVEELREAVSGMKREVDTFAGRLDTVEETVDEVSRRFENAEELKSLRREVDEELDGLREEMEEWVSDFEEETEKRIDAMDHSRKAAKSSEALAKVGLIERRGGNWSVGPTALDFRNLWRYGVLSSLVDATTPKTGTYRTPGEGAPEEAEELNWNELPVDEEKEPEW